MALLGYPRLHQTGTLEGRSTDYATAPRLVVDFPKTFESAKSLDDLVDHFLFPLLLPVINVINFFSVGNLYSGIFLKTKSLIELS